MLSLISTDPRCRGWTAPNTFVSTSWEPDLDTACQLERQDRDCFSGHLRKSGYASILRDFHWQGTSLSGTETANRESCREWFIQLYVQKVVLYLPKRHPGSTKIRLGESSRFTLVITRPVLSWNHICSFKWNVCHENWDRYSCSPHDEFSKSTVIFFYFVISRSSISQNLILCYACFILTLILYWNQS